MAASPGPRRRGDAGDPEAGAASPPPPPVARGAAASPARARASGRPRTMRSWRAAVVAGCVAACVGGVAALHHARVVDVPTHARAVAAAVAAAVGALPPSDAPWHVSPVTVTVCDDSCPTARDGVCDDGRRAVGAVACDVGRDCADCGPWTAALPPAMAAALPRPVADLRAAGVTDLRVTRTATAPSFLLLHTDPAADVDVSGQLAADRVVERGLTQLWHARLAGACGGSGGGGGRGRSARPPSLLAPPPPPPPLVLDVGANFGYYSLYAAALGCRAVAWEPVPRFRSFLLASLLLNPGAPLAVDPRPAAACAPSSPTNVTLAVPARGVWGTASVDGANIDAAVDNGGPLATATAPCETVDAVVASRARGDGGGARVAMLKADVEGFEPDVLAGAAALLSPAGSPARARAPALPPPPDNVVLEYSPGVYEARGRWADVGAWPAALTGLRRGGYALFSVPDARADLAGGDWGRPLPPLPTITDAVLAHDVADAARMAARALGRCAPAPPELKRIAPNAPWATCGAIPEALHPRSFRATFGHNTNVWAARGGEAPLAGLASGGEAVGVFGPADPPRGAWFSETRTTIGLGGRPCAGLPPEVQVAHRCRCRQAAVCGEEEAAAERAAAEGLLPPDSYDRAG